ncbi:hypothetical protein BTA51_22590 [Hahella sp. CCB-MM4]|uniref:COG4315 family predicted lipoprotein n=1 Tax=Hahella sp. (strain CCB-MM4) TaxID=1926491 RepID=UPI000B9C5A26|nr:hypothetical protein [Hahella sp. CCB-MM4]OZG71164.1 hypothetical protein BTA51_22590 [Hahella sp. CCB-MM4]
MKIQSAATALLSLTLVACAYGGGEYPAESHQTSAGTVLTTPEGMTLYTFDKDSKGQSNCYDQCAVKWPPFMAPQDAKASGDYSIVVRKDGTHQWAYKGAPLYTWFKDSKPGDAEGNGLGSVWHVIPSESKSHGYGDGGSGTY